MTDAERAAVLARLDAARATSPERARRSLQRWYAGTPTSTRRWLPHGGHAAGQRRATPTCIATGSSPPRTPQIGPELGRITAPALAITGELDPGSTPEMTRRLASALPDCRAVDRPRRPPHASRSDDRGLRRSVDHVYRREGTHV